MMKKVAMVAVASVAMAWSASAGVLYWGSYDAGTESYPDFKDNNNNSFSGYAYLFLLAASGDTVQWDAGSGTWNLNSATFLSVSTTTYDGNPGSWGLPDGDNAIANGNIIAGRYYQAILLTQPLGATSITQGGTQGLGGHWVSLSKETIPVVSGDDLLGKSGNLWWDTNDQVGSWAPVAAVPEPATMALFGLGGLALVIRRKMRKEA